MVREFGVALKNVQEYEYRKGQEVGKSYCERGVHRNKQRSQCVFEDCRATCLSEKNRKLITLFKDQECMVRAGEGLHDLGREAEKRQQGKAAERN